MKNRGVQSGLALLIESVHKEKGIPKEMLIEVIEQAMCKAAKSGRSCYFARPCTSGLWGQGGPK